MRSYHEIKADNYIGISKFHLEDAIQSRNVRSSKPRNLGKVRNRKVFHFSFNITPRNRRRRKV